MDENKGVTMAKHDKYEQPPPPSYGSLSPATPSFHLPSHLAAHLEALPALILASGQTHTAQQTSRDAAVLALLVPHIEQLLIAVAACPPPMVARLVLVPAAALPTGWSPSDPDHRPLRRESELRLLVRVANANTSSSFPSASCFLSPSEAPPPATHDGPAFDEWGRWGDDVVVPEADRVDCWASGEWWWADPAAASRLARLLQPQFEQPSSPSTPPHPLPQHQLGRDVPKKGKWSSLFRAEPPAMQSPAPIPPRSPLSQRTVQTDVPREPRVAMTVQPEQLSFRRENEFGVWESRGGWAIIVTVSVSTL